MKRIPIAALKRFAKEHALDQVIVTAWSDKEGLMYVATYGTTLSNCEKAAIGGNVVKRALGFPEDLCNDVPARVRRKLRSGGA